MLINENESEIIKYISNKPDVSNLHKSLPVIVKSVFGEASVILSIFKEIEENWSNLRVTIKSDFDAEKIIELEAKLFEKLEKDKSFIKALDYVTFCCE